MVSFNSWKYDAFICHASEDKEAVATPLAEALNTHGLEIWYDKFSLKTGDSLSGKIDEGLANSKYGIIIVSKKFFEKNWPQEEFHALHNRQVILRRKVILPIWHDITKEEVLMHSPLLADKFAQINGEKISDIATNLYKEIKSIETIYDFSDKGLRNTLASLSKSIQERESLIREAEQEILFIILSKIYLITKGYRNTHIYYQQFSESLCEGEEEERRLRRFMEDLKGKNFITSKALGTLSITHKGIKEIENLIEEDSSQTSSSLIATQIKNSIKQNEMIEIREVQKLRYDILKRESDLTKEKDEYVKTFDIAASLGIDTKKELHKIERIHFYLQDEDLIKPIATGGTFRVTDKGRQRVKESPGRIF